MSHYTIPTVVEKTPRGERAVDVYSRLLSDRIIYLGTEIDDGVANVRDRPAAPPGVGQSRSGDRPLHQLSRRLDVTAMPAIYDTMQFVRAPVATTCVGQAASAAAVLLAAGAPGHALRAAARPGGAAPAVGGRSGHASRPGAAGQGDCCGCARRWSRS